MTYVALFFDLVFVFAITQISHSLLAHSRREAISLGSGSRQADDV